MTWVTPLLWSETRSAEDVRCGIESGAEVVYAECREAEEAADRRHSHSDHLESFAVLPGFSSFKDPRLDAEGPLFYTGEQER